MKSVDSLIIKAENEKLSEGKIIDKIIILDNHTNHIRSHLKVLHNLKHRNNPEIVKNVLDHIQEHFELDIKRREQNLPIIDIKIKE